MQQCHRLFWRHLVFVILCILPLHAEPQKVAYLVEPIPDELGQRYRIELQFTGHESGRTELILPSRSASETQIYEAIQKLEILTPKIVSQDTSEVWVKTLTHEPGVTIRVRYEMAQDRPDALQALRGAGFRPILQPNYFHWLGNAWVRPGLEETAPINFTIEWKNLPADWTISNTFGANQRQQQFTANLRAFSSSVFVGGDFRLRTVSVKNQPVRIALRGAWAFTDEAFAALVEKIFQLQRGFWNDFNYPDYFVSLLPLEPLPQGAANSGTGLSQSFATFATPNCTLTDFKYLLAHELFHNWNSRRLGRVQEPQERLYWFTEGFTDFYSYRLLWRGGLLTFEEYLAKYNEVLRNYYRSPVRQETNERVAREFFTNSALSRLTYWRGHLLAANWDALIRINSQGKYSLDDVMLGFYRAANPADLQVETIAAAVQRLMKDDVLPDTQRIVDKGELLAPHDKVFGDCATLTTVEVADFELGFDLETLRTKQEVAGVIPNSAAYRTGLRDGMRLVKRTPIALGDATYEIEMTVREGNREKTIRYLPASNQKTLVPQFKPTARNAEQKAKCDRAF